MKKTEQVGFERLEKIVLPIEHHLIKRGFKLDGEPLMDATTRLASFKREDGAHVDYSFVLEKDEDNGEYASRTAFEVNIKLYCVDGKVVDLFPGQGYSTNMPATMAVESLVNETISINLFRNVPSMPIRSDDIADAALESLAEQRSKSPDHYQ